MRSGWTAGMKRMYPFAGGLDRAAGEKGRRPRGLGPRPEAVRQDLQIQQRQKKEREKENANEMGKPYKNKI